MAGILMAGGALVGLGWVSTLDMFLFVLFLNALAMCAEDRFAQPSAVVALVP